MRVDDETLDHVPILLSCDLPRLRIFGLHWICRFAKSLLPMVDNLANKRSCIEIADSMRPPSQPEYIFAHS